MYKECPFRMMFGVGPECRFAMCAWWNNAEGECLVATALNRTRVQPTERYRLTIVDDHAVIECQSNTDRTELAVAMENETMLRIVGPEIMTDDQEDIYHGYYKLY